MTRVLAFWPRARMRVLSLHVERCAAGAPIREVGRVDVKSDTVLGCRTEQVMSGRYDSESSRRTPFEGERLLSAVWDPVPADILVTADGHGPDLLPGEMTRGLPWIVVLRAWRALMPVAPSALLEVCWNRGLGSTAVPGGASRPIEAEVELTARMLLVLLERAPPTELVAYSGLGR